ncbi:flagellar hook-basal body complex protein [Marichromatium bheemlicum]
MELFGAPADTDQFTIGPSFNAEAAAGNTGAVTNVDVAVTNSSNPDILEPVTLVYQGANAVTGEEEYLLNGRLVTANVVAGEHVIEENGWQMTLTGGVPAVDDEFTLAFEPGAPVKFDQTDPNSYQYSTSLTLYDSLGAPRTATMYFVKTENTLEWEAYVDLAGSNLSPPQPQGPVKLTFDSNGVMTSPTTATDFEFDLANYDPVNGGKLGEIDPATGEASGVVSIDFSDITQFGPQYSVDDLNQDGFTTGRLVGFDVDQSGVVFARYTNGQAAALGQVALANFTNPQGLLKLGDNNWAESFAAGDVVYGEAGTSSLGLVQSGGLEASNVDLAEELVNLIVAQRNYQANAQTISTADAITQTIINIR